MAQKFLRVDSGGNIAELEATTQSSGAADAGEIVALNDEGKIDPSMLPDEALSPEIVAAEAAEDMNAGTLVYIYDDAGTVKCAKADASDINKVAIGFIKESVTTGGTVNVYFEGTIGGLSGLTVGDVYFLSDSTPGTVQNTPPTVTGHVVVRVGVAVSATEIQFERSQPIVRA